MVFRAIAQLPLIEINKTWNIARCSSAAPVCTTLFYEFGNLVEIDGINYYEVLVSELSSPDNWSVAGYIREVETGKVFYRHDQSSEEKILYDFSLNTGDTVKLESIEYGQCCSSTTTVDSVKNLNYNGINRKTLYVSSTNLSGDENSGKTYSIWIEGIGSKLGLLQPTECLYVGGFFYLLCCFVNEVLIYKNPVASSCIITSIKDNELQKRIKIDADNTNIIITNNSTSSIYVSFFSTDGKLQKSLSVPSSSFEIISKNKLLTGVCIIKVYNSYNFFCTKFLIP